MRRSVAGSGGTDQRRPEGRGWGRSRRWCRARRCRSGSRWCPRARDTDRVAAERRRAVREQHDRRRRAFAVGAARLALQRVERDLQGVAGGGAAVGDLVVDHAPHERVVGRRRLRRVGRVGEGRHADAHRRRQLVEERVRGVLRGLQAARVTSSAIIEREWSVTSMIEARSIGTATVRCGLASASASTAIDASAARPAGGAATLACRRRPARASPSPGSGPRSCARAGARRRAARAPAGGAPARAARVGRQSSSQPPPQLAQPVAGGGQRDVLDLEPAQLARQRRARRSPSSAAKRSRTRRRRCRPRRARPSRGRRATVARRRAARASRGSPTSIASTEWRARSAPSGRVQSSWSRKSEITHDEARAASRPCRRAAARPPAHGGPAAVRRARPRRARAAARPRPAWSRAAAASRGRPAPNVISATRPARRTASRPSTSAAPSATSAFRRSAVPNAIDGETSSTIHVVSVRSGTCRRTCGTPVRAVAAGSIWRTSSPSS